MFVVYLTTYRGNKLPPYYIGSTIKDKIDLGYHGSVCSRKWKEIYEEELRSNPDLFSTEIISTHPTRYEALEEERRLQIKNNVIKSDLYYNEAVAGSNWYYGRDHISGDLHHMYGKSWEEIYGTERSNEKKIKMSKHRKDNPVGFYAPGYSTKGENNAMYGKSVKDVWIEKYGKVEAEKMWKQKYENIKGKPAWNSNNKPVVQLDKEDNIICEYSGLQEVIDKNPNFNKPNICRVLRGDGKTSNNFKWKYKEDIR